MKKIIAVVLAAAAFAAIPAAVLHAADQEEQNLVTAAKQMRENGRVQMNFSELEVSKFIHFMSEVLGENIVVDPAVSGRVSVVSPKEVSIKEARQIMLSVLEMNNLAIQDMGGYSKVVPLSAGPSSSAQVYSGDYSVEPGEAVAVQVVPLKYVKADFVIAPLKAALPGLNASPAANGNSVVLTGKQTLLSKATKVIRAIDNQDAVRSIKVYTLKHAGAKSMETIFNSMGKDTTSKLAGVLAVGDARTRKMSVIGNAQAQNEVARLLKQLDVPSRAQKYHVYRLMNADAKTVAEQLTKILSGLAAADSIIVPVQCEYFAMDAISSMLAVIANIKQNYNPNLQIEGFLLTLYESKTSLGTEISSQVRGLFKENTFLSQIPRNISIPESMARGLPVTAFRPNSSGALAYFALAKEILDRN